MKAYGGVGVHIHVFFISALDWIRPWERAPGTHWIGGWVDPWDNILKLNSWPYRNPNCNQQNKETPVYGIRVTLVGMTADARLSHLFVCDQGKFGISVHGMDTRWEMYVEMPLSCCICDVWHMSTSGALHKVGLVSKAPPPPEFLEKHCHNLNTP
jgi:hypothetical protein